MLGLLVQRVIGVLLFEQPHFGLVDADLQLNGVLDEVGRGSKQVKFIASACAFGFAQDGGNLVSGGFFFGLVNIVIKISIDLMDNI